MDPWAFSPRVSQSALTPCPAPSEFSLDANIRRGQQAGGDVMSEKSANTAHLFEIVRTTRSMRAAEAGPGAERTDPKDPGGRGLCPEWRKYAALALPVNP